MQNVTQTQKFKAIFYAATIAIIINIIILKSAPIFHINAASGGLFGLLRHLLGSTFHEYGISIFWTSATLPQPGRLGFFILFHTFSYFYRIYNVLYLCFYFRKTPYRFRLAKRYHFRINYMDNK